MSHIIKRFFYLLLILLPAAYFFLFLFKQDVLPKNFQIQLLITRSWVITLLSFILFHFINLNNRIQHIKDFFFEPISPINLAMFRILHHSLMFVGIVFLHQNMGKLVTRGFETFPETSRVPIPYAEYIFSNIPVNPELVHFAALAFNICVILSFLGLFTPISTKAYLLLALYLFGIPKMFGKVAHTHYMVWFPAILAFSDCGRVFSLDSLIRKYVFKKPIDFTPSPNYGLPLKFAMILLGIIYFFPGFWKLWNGGFDWIFQLNIKNLMYSKWHDMNNWLPFFRIDHYPFLVIIGALFVVSFEFGFIFLVLKKSYRLLLFLGGILMHTGIYLFMKIPFFILLLDYSVLIDWVKFFKVKTGKTIPINPLNVLKSNMLLVIIFSAIAFGNVIFGFAKIENSWPLACFPTFDYILPDQIEVIYYEAYSHGKISISNQEIKDRIFKKMPHYYIKSLEDKMIRSYYKNDTAGITNAANQIIPFKQEFNDLDSIKFSIILKNLNPDKTDSTKNKVNIYTLRLQ